jgi:hypothetical protein
MGHHIRAIIAPHSTADAIAAAWAALPRLNLPTGFAIFPVDAETVDARVVPDPTLKESANELIMMTPSFRAFLAQLSRGGQLAYVETDYFGGMGGQGALVCRNGEEAMPPTWRTRGAINRALKLLGMPGGLLRDRFVKAGLHRLRDNDDILDEIAAQTPPPT